MKIPYLVGIGIAIIGLIAIVGLSQSAVDDSQNKIRVAFFPSIVHAVPIVGMENQTFADNLDGDMNIEVKIFDSGPQVIESIFSNSVDLAYVGPGPVINGYLKSDGKDLKILASAANGGASFIIQKNSGLESIENYSGKRVAAPQISNTQDVSLRHYLAQNGLTPAEKGGDVFVLNIANPDIYTLFAKGDIDGALKGARVHAVGTDGPNTVRITAITIHIITIIADLFGVDDTVSTESWVARLPAAVSTTNRTLGLSVSASLGDSIAIIAGLDAHQKNAVAAAMLKIQ